MSYAKKEMCPEENNLKRIKNAGHNLQAKCILYF